MAKRRLVAIALAGLLCACNAQTQTPAGPSFAAVAESKGGVWRVNLRNGDVAYCAADSVTVACQQASGGGAPLSPERERKLKDIFGF